MSDADASSERDPIDLLSEQFLERHRRGDRVAVADFVAEHPAHAEQLRELLPTLLMLEEVKRDRESSGSGQRRVSVPDLDRLGDFRIERELGRGGMGVVFEAVQESLDRRVALKVMPQASLLTGNQLERFRREAQIAARLHHTNIVPVYGSGESDGYHWYAMQFIAGDSLDRWRQRQSERPPSGSGQWRSRARFVARIGLAAADALHYAHGLGTMHRDIKPANFLIDQHDHVWVTDFGLAKALEAEGLTHSGDLVGTLQYMAPEQFAGQYDVRSEVYALGVTLYELLTLAPAFRGRHRSELIERVQSQRIEPLARSCPDVPGDLAVIIGKAMAREPADRYRNAEELQQDLQAFLDERPIRARRLSHLAAAWRWCRRNRGMASLAAAAAAAVVVAAITGWLAYSVTGDALRRANAEGERAEGNLRLSMEALGDVFDALVGRDQAMSLEEDPDTGEQTVVVHTPVSPRDVELMQQVLAFYDQFANSNAASESLRYETARAYRRVGEINSRVGGVSHLQAAEVAYDKALAGFESVRGRDVRRDVATVLVGLGTVQTRRHDMAGARASFARALAIFAALPDAASVANRLQRAKLLFEIARADWFRGFGSRSRRPDARAAAKDGKPSGRETLQRARALLDELCRESPEDPDVLAMLARCLREGVRRIGAPHEDHAMAIEILRGLVASHPDRDDYRFELCEALLRRPPGRRSERGSAEDRIAMLREADESAERLWRTQPLFREYQGLLLRVRSRLGHELHDYGLREQDIDAGLEAEEKLLSALPIGQQLVTGDESFGSRFVRDVVQLHSWLGLHFEATKRPDLAREQAGAVIDLIAAQIDARRDREADASGSAAQRPPPEQGPPERQRERPPGARRDDRRMRGYRRGNAFFELMQRLDDDELRQRLEQLWQRPRRR